jgi:hypothetical protein
VLARFLLYGMEKSPAGRPVLGGEGVLMSAPFYGDMECKLLEGVGELGANDFGSICLGSAHYLDP